MHDYLSQIRHEAEASRSREVCGFLLLDGEGSLGILPAANIAPDNNNWEIHPEVYARALQTGRLFGLYHSHVIVDEQFSKEDIKCSDVSHLPMFVYSLLSGRFNYYRPREVIKPLVGRSFILGVSDCYTLVQDYYSKMFGIELPFYPRTPEVIEKGFDAIAHLSREMVVVKTPQTGDLLTFSIANEGRANHAGIYIGDGVMLHQLMGRESNEQKLTENWLNKHVMTLRLR